MSVLPGYQNTPEVGVNDVEHRRKLARAINSILQGKMNAVTTLTFTANSATSVLTDDRITPNSFIGLMPTNVNSALALLAGWYVSNRISTNGNIRGNATFVHANNAQVDRTFTVLIIG